MTADPDHPRSSRRLMVQLSGMMFLQSWTLGAWVITAATFITANTGEAGDGTFSAGFAGYSTATSALGGLIAPVLIGAVSDRHFSAHYLLSLLNVGCALACYGMFVCSSQTVFFLCLFLFFQCFFPGFSLANSISFQHLENPSDEFPILRVAGALGWVTAGLFIGLAWPWMTGESIERTRTPFAVGAVASVIKSLYCLTLPKSAPAKRSVSALRSLAAATAGNRSLLVLLGVSFLIAVPNLAYNNFTNAYLNWEGYPSPAALLTIGQLSELTLLAVMPWFVARLGLRRLIVLGAAAWAARYWLLSWSAWSGCATPALLAIGLHGCCFAWVYVSGSMLVDKLVEPELRGSIHGVYTSVMFGFANLASALACGAFQERLLTPAGVSPAPYDWTTYWAAFAGISTAALMVTALVLQPSQEAAGESDGASTG